MRIGGARRDGGRDDPVRAAAPPVWLPLLDLLAPPEPAGVHRRMRNFALLGSTLPWLLPESAVFGNLSVEHRVAASVAFFVAAVVAQFVKRWEPRGWAAAATVLVAGVVAGPTRWSAGLAVVAALGPVVSHLRRRALPLDDDSHRFPLFAGIVWSIVGVVIFREFAGLPIQVPTGSMQPTIYGARPGPRGDLLSGDHLLVDRTTYLAADPRRWDIAVFDFPLHRPTAFVKRVIGLPGETVEIRDGDLWIDGRAARKPPLLQETLWRELFPQPNPVATARKVAQSWTASGPWTVHDEEVRCAPSKGKSTALRYTPSLPQGDLRLAATVRADSGCTAILRISTRGRRIELRWAAEGAETGSSLRVGGEPVVESRPAPPTIDDAEKPIADRAVAGSEHRLELALADGQAVARVDGRVVAEALFGADGPGRHRVELAGEGPGGGAAMTFSGLRLDQDQSWRPARDGTSRWDVPAGCYFVLGDHSEQSEDSREWRVTEFALADGRVLRAAAEYPDERGAPTTNVRRDGDSWVFHDVEGIARRVPVAGTRRTARAEPAPFVPRGHFLGRALLIFWPWTVDEGGFRPRLLP